VNVLIIGGTRFVGHLLATALSQRGHAVTVFHRGDTPGDLPPAVERIHGDRTEPGGLARALGGRAFDGAVDMIAMRGADTKDAITALDGRVGRFVHVSTGQVYLVRQGIPTPAREDDYDGPLTTAPPATSWERREWDYGVEKRACEDALAEAWATRGFPSVRLRMPIIHGPRDPSGRLAGYVARLADGGPLVVPEEPGAALRHVWAGDVAGAIETALTAPGAAGRAYNVSSDDLWTHHSFVTRLAELVHGDVRLAPIPRARLLDAGLLPACAPFASPWMSVLDNTRAKAELGLAPAGFETFLPGRVREILETRAWPPSYAAQREAELRIAGATA
jgi:nucleoside-diphosphate-sugar epimerase